MGLLADHYELAKKLKRMSAAHAVASPGDPDWGLVMLFYAALHVTTAYMVHVGEGVPGTHKAMAAAVAKRKELDTRFQGAYGGLSALAWQVRYNPGYVSQANERSRANGRLVQVKAFVEPDVRKALGLPAGTDL